MGIEKVLENPHVTISRCKPFQKASGELHYPYKYTITYCYYSWNHGREFHTNDPLKSVIELLNNLRIEHSVGINNGMSLEEIDAQLNHLITY